MQRAESVNGVPNTKAPNLFAIPRALDQAGILFLDVDDVRGGGLGVWFKA